MKKLIRNILMTFAIGFGIFSLLFLFSDRQELQTAFTTFSKKLIFHMTVILAVDYIMGGLRNYVVLKSVVKRIRFLDAMENYFFGVFFSFVTPMSIGGQPFQIYHLITKIGVDSADATNVVLSRMFSNLIINFIIALLFLPKAIQYLTNKTQLIIISLGLAISIGVTFLCLLAFLNAKFVAKILHILAKTTRNEKFKKISENTLAWVSKMTESTKVLWTKNLYVMIIDMLLGVIMYIFLIPIQLYLPLVHMSGKNFQQIHYFGFVSLYILISSTAIYIPTPGSTGGVEGLCKIVFSNIFGSGVSTYAILIWRLMNYYLPIGVGLALIWRINIWNTNVMDN
ncbi:lysylphosphatidylglycerol synthase transmembrane domain-containing protein [Pseudothermotoga thermarum]|uniref:Lysylphosphatidylglycerol synthetase/UPF0104 n=1 Tax=Pseudothermotoga thermarum DSM 5069 TaxID=688269 RepID=F7YV42_9THEM|nr:lysylphosphatidylglycerol synthase transmembrane domain-containing protein [Pseudothermotoga thermarum]AEH50339.1 hypothetical protein Theth_0239 [Pseudothermotoga thermarum DSM 5069]